MPSRRLLAAVCLCLSLGASAAARAADPPRFNTLKLAGAKAATEPRVTVTPNDRRYVVTNDAKTGNSIVYRSSDAGASFGRTESEPANGVSATIDVDIVSTHTNRIISSELDDQAISFITSYSDDGGKTWTQSRGGSQTGDSDRQWLAVGPDDPATHKPRVYLLYHNLASGTAQHNMFVAASTDGGETFGAPAPITLPPSQAYQDLQCSDSGGPSNIFVNPRTGRVYAVWGTRSAPTGGGCGASVFGPFEVNVVAATRIWVASSPDGSAGSWDTHLGVDDNATNQIVGMQLNPGALDNAGNLYLAYTESPDPYPNYDGAPLKYVWAPPTLQTFSKPVTVVPPGGAGHVLPHIVAGDPGKLDFAYFTGTARGDPKTARPVWHTDVSQTLNGQDAAPSFASTRLSDVTTYTGTASELMGACGEGPIAGVENGFTCTRSTDVWGVALDGHCRLTVAWPARDNTTFAKGTARRPGDPAFDAPGNDPGTFASTQTSGPDLCADPAKAGPGLPPGGAAPRAVARPCRDRIATTSRFDRRRSRLTRRGIRVRGRSSDRGCRGAAVAARIDRGVVRRVLVAFGRAAGHGRCRFLRANGRLDRARSCRRRSYLPARGTTRWSLVKRVKLRPGRYFAWVRGIDGRGHRERVDRRPNRIRVRVR